MDIPIADQIRKHRNRAVGILLNGRVETALAFLEQQPVAGNHCLAYHFGIRASAPHPFDGKVAPVCQIQGLRLSAQYPIGTGQVKIHSKITHRPHRLP